MRIITLLKLLKHSSYEDGKLKCRRYNVVPNATTAKCQLFFQNQIQNYEVKL